MSNTTNSIFWTAKSYTKVDDLIKKKNVRILSIM